MLLPSFNEFFPSLHSSVYIWYDQAFPVWIFKISYFMRFGKGNNNLIGRWREERNKLRQLDKNNNLEMKRRF